MEVMAVKEVLKYKEVKNITVVDIDPAMTDLAKTHPAFRKLNGDSMNNSKTHIVNQDAYKFLQKSEDLYDVIIIDLPDPNSIQLARLYSRGFYTFCKNHLTKFGVIVTQSASPLYTKKAFLTIMKTMESVGITVLPYHNQIPTMGEWGWNLGVRDELIGKKELKGKVQKLDFNKIPTRFLNQDAMISMTHFGKGIFDIEEDLEVNTELNPVLDQYYREGSWALY